MLCSSIHEWEAGSEAEVGWGSIPITLRHVGVSSSGFTHCITKLASCYTFRGLKEESDEPRQAQGKGNYCLGEEAHLQSYLL